MKHCVSVLCLFAVSVISVNLATARAQQPVPRAADVGALSSLAKDLKAQYEREHAEAIRWAVQNQRGPLRIEDPDGGVIELMYMRDGRPVYYVTDNADSTDTISADEVHFGGSSGLNLDGTGVLLHVWDGGGVRATHQEMLGRVTVRDGAGLYNHSTHVGGTMIASGLDPQAHGMSNLAMLDSYEWGNDEGEMALAGAGGARVSNHSYGISSGWRWDSFAGAWRWYGEVTVSTTEDPDFGRYDNAARNWDQIAFNAPYYLIVGSAGNERDDVGAGAGGGHYHFRNGAWEWATDTHPADGGGTGYDTISSKKNAKNILSVGSTLDVPGGYFTPGGVILNGFSSWGPTDDGRVKPDLVANGNSLYSCSSSSDVSYVRMSGTSMSSPSVAGAMGLLIQHYRLTHGWADMRSATLKGLAIHTADETGSAPGPDYSYGWGLVNVLKATQHIEHDVANPETIQELTIQQGQTLDQIVTYNGGGLLRATICWTDPPGTAGPYVVDSPILKLMNDLDLRVIGPSGTEFPWVLDPSSPWSPATTGDNFRDNVESILVNAPAAGDYTVRVTHKGTLSGGSQDFSLLLTGAGSNVTIGACCQLGGTVCTDETVGSCLVLGGVYKYGGNLCTGDANSNGIDDACECSAPDPPLDEPTPTPKNRYLSFEATNTGQRTALRVTMAGLPAPYDIWNGRTMWVADPTDVTENSGASGGTPAPTFKAAHLSCDIDCRDWGALGVITVYGEAVIPDAQYDVQAVHCSCDTNSDLSFSSALALTTSAFGDLVGQFDPPSCDWTAPDGVVGIPFDTVADVDKFRNVACALRKSRADVIGVPPNERCVDRKITVSDYVATINAFLGADYPYSPSDPDPCNALPCP